MQLDDANGYFNLNIYNNSSLTFGAVESICTYLNLGKPSTINSNSVGCNSAQEILSVCQTLSISQSDLENIELYPNPTTNNFFISGNDFVGMKFTIMDNLGRRMNYKKMAENEISIENLPAGIYIVKFVFGEKTNYKKIIKK